MRRRLPKTTICDSDLLRHANGVRKPAGLPGLSRGGGSREEPGRSAFTQGEQKMKRKQRKAQKPRRTVRQALKHAEDLGPRIEQIGARWEKEQRATA